MTTADAHALLGSSGVHQNVLFLLQLFQRLPEVELAAVVSCPSGAASHPIASFGGLAHLPQEEAVAQLDVIVELGFRADAPSMARFRDRGGRLVSYMAGNVMAMNFEALANRAEHGEMMSAAGFDAVWITPQHWRMNRSYAAATRSPEVALAPHIWTPSVLLASAAQAGASPFWKPREEAPWRIGVFEPNVNVLKTFHLPLLVCEEAYRRRPGLIDRVLLFNTAPLAQAPHFAEFCSATDLARAGRLSAEARFPLVEVLGRYADAVVTHQWENALNYLYWEVLYLGYPLIHNSPEIADVGFYYPDFSPQHGGEVLCRALDRHAVERTRERPRELETLWRFDIDNPQVQRAYSDLLQEVVG